MSDQGTTKAHREVLTPLFDDVARDGEQGYLAHLIRAAVKIAPFGPNSKACHEAGASVALTPAEAEQAARAVLESDWFERAVRIRVAQERGQVADRIERMEPEAGPMIGYLVRRKEAARVAREGGTLCAAETRLRQSIESVIADAGGDLVHMDDVGAGWVSVESLRNMLRAAESGR